MELTNGKVFYMIYQEPGNDPVVLTLQNFDIKDYEEDFFVTKFRFENEYDAKAACSAYDLYSYVIKTSKGTLV